MSNETLSHVLAKLEGDSGFEGCRHNANFTPELQAQLSIAISLRRIADVIAPENAMSVNDIAFEAMQMAARR